MSRLNEVYTEHKVEIDTNAWYIINKQDYIDRIKQDIKEMSSSTLPNLLHPGLINTYIRELIMSIQDPSEDIIG